MAHARAMSDNMAPGPKQLAPTLVTLEALAEKYKIPATDPLFKQLTDHWCTIDAPVTSHDLVALRRVQDEQGAFADRSPERYDDLYQRGYLSRRSMVYEIKRTHTRGDRVQRRWFYELTPKAVAVLQRPGPSLRSA